MDASVGAAVVGDAVGDADGARVGASVWSQHPKKATSPLTPLMPGLMKTYEA